MISVFSVTSVSPWLKIKLEQSQNLLCFHQQPGDLALIAVTWTSVSFMIDFYSPFYFSNLKFIQQLSPLENE